MCDGIETYLPEDAVDGTFIAYYVAMVYALANQPGLAFEQLNSLVKIPGGELNYGDLKTAAAWDPLRKDPRFDKLLAELAPRDRKVNQSMCFDYYHGVVSDSKLNATESPKLFATEKNVP